MSNFPSSEVYIATLSESYKTKITCCTVELAGFALKKLLIALSIVCAATCLGNPFLVCFLIYFKLLFARLEYNYMGQGGFHLPATV